MNTPRSKPIVRYGKPRGAPPKSRNALAPRSTGELKPTDFLVEIGRIITQWAHLEEQMAQFFMSTLLDSPQNYTHARLIFRSVNSTQARIAIMRALLEEAPANKDRSVAYDEIITEFESLTTERNNCAHGLWWTTDSGKVSRSDPSHTNETISFALAHRVTVAQLKNIWNRMIKLRSKITNEFVAAQAQQKARPQPSSVSD